MMKICRDKYTKIRLKSQIVVVINGKGGVGKDTICDLAERVFYSKNVSAITPIKQIAKQCGWKGEKDAKSRKFLSDLKQLLIDYNDLPNRYLLYEYEQFKKSSELDLLFVHIREAYQITDFLSRIEGKFVTLLIRSKRANIVYGNLSDDDVEKYRYDYVLDNDYDEQELFEVIKKYFIDLFIREGVL